MEKLATKILSRLSSAYPSFVQLEECRRTSAKSPRHSRGAYPISLKKNLSRSRTSKKGNVTGYLEKYARMLPDWTISRSAAGRSRRFG